MDWVEFLIFGVGLAVFVSVVSYPDELITLFRYITNREKIREAKKVLLEFYKKHDFKIIDSPHGMMFFPQARKNGEWLDIDSEGANKWGLETEKKFNFSFGNSIGYDDYTIWNFDYAPGNDDQQQLNVSGLPPETTAYCTSPLVLYLALNSKTRLNIEMLAQESDYFEIRDWRIEISMSCLNMTSVEKLERIIDAAQSIADRFSSRWNYLSRLRETAIIDPEPQYRRDVLACLGALLINEKNRKLKNIFKEILLQALHDEVIHNQIG